MWLLVIAFLGVLLFTQWPMLKGRYYRASQSAPPESAIEWQPDFETALTEARESEKPVLMVFGATWCPPCLTMKHDVWPDEKVSDVVNQKFVPFYVDVDERKHAEVVSAYGISGIPAVLIVDAEGQVREQAAYMSRAEVLRFLNGYTS